MPLLAIPNVSEGRDAHRMSGLRTSVESEGVRVLDLHADAVHNRCVLTTTGDPTDLPRAMAMLASAASSIDLTEHSGVHPRLGVLDVCPIVPHVEPMDRAVEVAYATGEAITAKTGLPVYFYGAAALRPGARDLPGLRRGGLEALRRRAREDLPPDLGGPEIDPVGGVVCVGARDVLIAFNVWLRCTGVEAKAIARAVRSSGGGPVGVRALGLDIDPTPTSQVSMNLIEPDTTGIDAAFAAVAQTATRMGVTIVATEIVGLVPERYLPAPDAPAARLLMAPGRPLEAALYD